MGQEGGSWPFFYGGKSRLSVKYHVGRKGVVDVGLFFIKDVTDALNRITGGRLSENWNDVYAGVNPYVVMKSSNLPGKAIMETPGLVYGHPDKPLRKLAVVMTLTEQVIELAAATGVDAVVAHHPIADAASSGGVLLKTYLDLYGLSVFELHEAFHGLHPGMAYIHGHVPFITETACRGVPGRIYHIGQVFPEIRTLDDLLQRVLTFSGWDDESFLLEQEKRFKKNDGIHETNVEVKGEILLGRPDARVKKILHIFPHTGFDILDLEEALKKHADIDTVLASVSRVRKDHPLVQACDDLGLNFILGSSHAIEILENGVPLGRALQELLPGVEIVLFRQKVYSYPLDALGTRSLNHYGLKMSREHLLKPIQDE